MRFLVHLGEIINELDDVVRPVEGASQRLSLRMSGFADLKMTGVSGVRLNMARGVCPGSAPGALESGRSLVIH